MKARERLRGDVKALTAEGRIERDRYRHHTARTGCGHVGHQP